MEEESYVYLINLSKRENKHFELSEKLKPYLSIFSEKSFQNFYRCLRSGENSRYLFSYFSHYLSKDLEKNENLKKVLYSLKN